MTRSITARLSLLLVSLAVVVADRASKLWIIHNIILWQERVVIPGFFHLTHLENHGAAFGIFTQNPSSLKLWLLISFSIIALLVVCFILFRATFSQLAGVGLALIVGGAIGNLWDRIHNGYVVDFLDFFIRIGGHRYDYWAFNIADSAIVTGAFLLLYEMLFAKSAPETPKSERGWWRDFRYFPYNRL